MPFSSLFIQNKEAWLIRCHRLLVLDHTLFFCSYLTFSLILFFTRYLRSLPPFLLFTLFFSFLTFFTYPLHLIYLFFFHLSLFVRLHCIDESPEALHLLKIAS